jgi:hypothetical protein
MNSSSRIHHVLLSREEEELWESGCAMSQSILDTDLTGFNKKQKPLNAGYMEHHVPSWVVRSTTAASTSTTTTTSSSLANGFAADAMNLTLLSEDDAQFSFLNEEPLLFMDDDVSPPVEMSIVVDWKPLANFNLAELVFEHAINTVEVLDMHSTEQLVLMDSESVLRRKNPIASDDLVVLIPDGHLYLWRTSKKEPFRRGLTTSVSAVYHMVEEEFNSGLMSYVKAKSNRKKAGINDDDYGKGILDSNHVLKLEETHGLFNAKSLAKSWETKGQEAAALGTRMHKQIEEYYEFGMIPQEPTDEFKEFLEFAKEPAHSRELIFRTEVTMLYTPLLMTGQADAFFRVSKHSNEVDIYDCT